MSDAAIARRYAKALFDCAPSQSMVVKFQDQLQRVSQAADAVHDLWKTLGDERRPLAKRLAVVDALGKALQLDATVVHFWKILVEKRRANCWAEVVKAFDQLAAKAAGLVKVEVTTATPLTSKELSERLTQALKQLTHKNVDVQLAVDDALIGGAVVRIDDTIYDGSLKTDLRHLKQKLKDAVL